MDLKQQADLSTKTVYLRKMNRLGTNFLPIKVSGCHGRIFKNKNGNTASSDRLNMVLMFSSAKLM